MYQSFKDITIREKLSGPIVSQTVLIISLCTENMSFSSPNDKYLVLYVYLCLEPLFKHL